MLLVIINFGQRENLVLNKRYLLKLSHTLNKDDNIQLADSKGQMFPGENGESHGDIVLFCLLKRTPDCRQYRRHGLKGEITNLEEKQHEVGLGTSTMRTPSGKIAWQKYNIR